MDPFPCLYRKIVKANSSMNMGVPTAEAGPSSNPTVSHPFPDVPPIDIDPHSKHLALVLEVIPDVVLEHV